MTEYHIPAIKNRLTRRQSWLTGLLLIAILAAGAYFRLVGLYWGEYQYLHPDERFLVWVGTDISPVNSLAEYFNTANSSLNPHNRGHGFYVYGTLPMFIARYAVEAIFGHSGFQEMTQVGRALSALVDLLVVLLVFLTAERLYGKRVGLLAAAFSAAVVLQIQQSHFFTMDTFVNFFSFLAFYFAVLTATQPVAQRHQEQEGEERLGADQRWRLLRDPLFWYSLGFGIALGMAVSSKLNAAAMAVALPAAMLVHLLRLPASQRDWRGLQAFVYLVIAAIFSLLVFRICQPYAFSGPGFFGVTPNEAWLRNIRELQAQSGGDVDFPPAMQWARRPVWFSLQNMVLWGLGLPLGILAWAGFAWAGWRMISRWGTQRSEILSHILIWGWTAVYFSWQSLALNPTMRYQLPIYPMLAIFAAWLVVALWDKGQRCVTDLPGAHAPRGKFWLPLAAAFVGSLVLVATYAYAFAFTRLYVRPITRVAASRWIYQNIPGPINLPIQTEQGIYSQPLAVPYELNLTPATPFATNFRPRRTGILSEIYLPRVRDQQAQGQPRTLTLTISALSDTSRPLASAMVVQDLVDIPDLRGIELVFKLDQPVSLEADKEYNLRLALAGEPTPPAVFDGRMVLSFDPATADPAANPILQPINSGITTLFPDTPFPIQFVAETSGMLTQVHLPGLLDLTSANRIEKVELSLLAPGSEPSIQLSNLIVLPDPNGEGFEFLLDTPVSVEVGQTYALSLQMTHEGGRISLSGISVANEGEWDDGLPLRVDGYDGFGGIYPRGLDFNMYWDDNPEKLERFLRILENADYILISSNRQWGTLPRIPERFPMTAVYYRNLLGCPDSQAVEDCYKVATPGLFQGNLGFELVQTFTSEPCLWGICLNDQFAEEAFTVYDHPKVLILKKTAQYNSQQAREILSAVDFSKIIRMPPMRYPDHPANLELPADRLGEQRAGGTWSELFDTQAIYNRSQPVGVVLWYLTILVLGLAVYPLLRLILPGLPDHGYPLARTAGLLILSYCAWLAGSVRVPYSRATIGVVFVTLLLLGLYLAMRQRAQLRQEWMERRNYFLIVEILALVFFLAFLLVRVGNPDLWHPWKGGEKPMDFAYFNAILKSTSFPPYDPWYAGGYLNYYYYGFVVVGTPVKMLGITPAFAYNLVLPLLFSLIAMGGFSLAWNLSVMGQSALANWRLNLTSPYYPAITGAFLTAVLGNLGTVRMIYQGFQRLAAPGGVIEDAGIFIRLVWAIRGFWMTIVSDAHLPYSIGDWYWIPSRAIPAPGDVEPITEFPYFTVLYADLHAHLMALPITLLVIGVLIAMIHGRARWSGSLSAAGWFLLAGLSIGALRPANTWDFPPYLALGVVAVFYTLWVNFRPPSPSSPFASLGDLPAPLLRFGVAAASAILLIGLAFILFQPFAQWYALGYTKIDLWKGTHTPTTAYLVHWGLFLFLIISWMGWETLDWMAHTPLSSLRLLQKHRLWIYLALMALGVLVVGLLWMNVFIAWLALPLAAWAGILLLRPGLDDARRIALFLVGTGLVLTLMVEIIVLAGDIGRMNTVFKFYLQVWIMFSVSAAAALGWMIEALPKWRPEWRSLWQAGLTLLFAGAALYTLTATMAKMDDRMAPQAPRSLDGMGYMPYATYTDDWGTMDLSQDYGAIRWLQENVAGSPVILEANLRNLYRWGSRVSIYTGLPGVVGWEWHQQQQRTRLPGNWVSERIAEIDRFYLTTNLIEAGRFLRKYDVRYIIVGQQERGHYPGPGLDKFEDADGAMWNEVYRDVDTVIYRVIQQPWNGSVQP